MWSNPRHIKANLNKLYKMDCMHFYIEGFSQIKNSLELGFSDG